MRLLMNFFTRPDPVLLGLPSGSFTVDREGSILVGTLPSSFPPHLVEGIAQQVLAAFRQAEEAHLPLSELVLHFASLKIKARELRGGALIYLSPKTTVLLAKKN
jgi:hypothetical protein